MSQNTSIPPPTLKVVLLGDSGVGKTCLRSQFVYHIYTNAYKATIGGDYLTTTVNLGNDNDNEEEEFTGNVVNLQIWDTAGQERFNSISQAFYRGADMVVLVYDITNYESLLSLKDWFKRFIEHCHVENPGVIIVGNKADKVSNRCIDLDEVKDILSKYDDVNDKNGEIDVGDYIQDWDDCLVEISCKKLELVNLVFEKVAKIALLRNLQKPIKKLQKFDNIDLRGDNNRVNTKKYNNCAC